MSELHEKPKSLGGTCYHLQLIAWRQHSSRSPETPISGSLRNVTGHAHIRCSRSQRIHPPKNKEGRNRALARVPESTGGGKWPRFAGFACYRESVESDDRSSPCRDCKSDKGLIPILWGKIHFVNVAPGEVFSRRYRLHNRMSGRFKMFRCVFILRTVATADVAADQAHAQVNPRIADLYAFFANGNVLRMDIPDLVFMGTSFCRHALSIAIRFKL